MTVNGAVAAPRNPSAKLPMELGVSTGSQDDRLTIAGTVTVCGSLDVQTINGFNPQIGKSFTLIDNLGTGPIPGTFSGIGEGALFTAAGTTFLATYHGGTGNDFVITPVPEPALLLLVAAVGGGAWQWRASRRQRGVEVLKHV